MTNETMLLIYSVWHITHGLSGFAMDVIYWREQIARTPWYHNLWLFPLNFLFYVLFWPIKFQLLMSEKLKEY